MLGTNRSTPVLIWVLLAVLAAVFGVELLCSAGDGGGSLEPSVATLIALGGLNGTLVFQDGEWYRLFAAPLLHGSLVHLALNGLALLIAGGLLERLVGRAWLLALFALGALGGSLMSLAINPPNVVSVGASGAIMGLLATGLVLSFGLPRGPQRTQVQLGMLQMLVPSLLPLAASVTGQHVDFGAHLGGTLAGAAAGLAMLIFWRKTSPLPPAVGRVLAAAGLAAFAWAAVATAANYPSYAAELIPSDQLAKGDAADGQALADLVAHYPRDPRGHFLRAESLLDAGDEKGAEQELRAALAQERTLSLQFKPELEWRLRTLLALLLADEGRTADAAETAEPVCAAAAPASMLVALANAHLCAQRH
ncbi:MAG TPA: rhomboid family intramembrane serine protease [Stellaceae bacterium]|nr:rhomboid family intramembrane serine protease [Stellaceae bacterium]